MKQILTEHKSRYNTIWYYTNINNNEFILKNDLLKEFYDIKEEIKNSKDKYKFIYEITSYCLKHRKNTENKNPKVVGTRKETMVLSNVQRVINTKVPTLNDLPMAIFFL